MITIDQAKKQEIDNAITAQSRAMECTPAQGLVALYDLKNITEQDIYNAITSIEDAGDAYRAKIGYEKATLWQRGSATMTTLAALLGLTEDDLDALFTYSITVKV